MDGETAALSDQMAGYSKTMVDIKGQMVQVQGQIFNFTELYAAALAELNTASAQAFP